MMKGGFQHVRLVNINIICPSTIGYKLIHNVRNQLQTEKHMITAQYMVLPLRNKWQHKNTCSTALQQQILK